MAETRTLPVLPLRNLVLFPDVPFSIGVVRPITVRAMEAALNKGDQRVFAVAQRQETKEVRPSGLYKMGTIARVQVLQPGLAGLQVLLHGEHRAIASRFKLREGLMTATVSEAEEDGPEDLGEPAFEALHREVRERATELGQKSGLPEQAVHQVLAGIEDPGQLADFVAAHLDIEVAERQGLLATLSVQERLHQVLVHLQRQISIKDAREEINSKVQKELGDRQREMHLREQLKVIQGELGDTDSDLEELGSKLEALDLPAEARERTNRDLDRLRRLPPESSESQLLSNYLQTVVELPWSERSDERLDLESASEILEADHYGLAEVKDRVLEFLAVRRLRRTTTDEKGALGPILLFVGPPGVGKTSLARSIARAMGREYVRISLGGIRDEADIRGHRRTYVGAMPGRILQGMRQAGTVNPVFLLDEVDKLGVSGQGDPAAALLEVLDPAQNDTFTDHYLGLPYDLSEVLFIATANFLAGVCSPLLDRMEVVSFSGYTENEKLAIAQQYLLPRQIEQNGLSAAGLTVSDGALREIMSGYTREAGVRQLERQLGKLARKLARKIVAGEDEPAGVESSDVAAILGRPEVHLERAERQEQIGVATGMYYTPAGGDIMFVEAATMPGTGKLIITGQLGDVMQESARAVWTYARTHAAALQIDTGIFERDVHIHVPAGAVRKDGPSAGLAMATALISALSARPVRPDIGVTGEITLTGRVLPIGGVKEKLLGAVRSGITEFALPKENEGDLEDLPDEVRQSIQVHLVEELGEALALTLNDASFEEGRLLFGDDRPEDVLPLSRFLHSAAEATHMAAGRRVLRSP
ncbi:MAG: endopeptidase La [Thermoanaerobaculia bacterium]